MDSSVIPLLSSLLPPFFGLQIALLVIVFLFYGLCQFVLAKKLHFSRPWLAFIPVANVYQQLEIVGWDRRLFALFFIPLLNLFIIAYFYYCFGKRFQKNPILFAILYPIFFPVLCFSFNPEKETFEAPGKSLIERLLNTPQSEFPDPNNPNPRKRRRVEESLDKFFIHPTGPSEGALKYNIPKAIFRMGSEAPAPARSFMPNLSVVKSSIFARKSPAISERDPFADAEKLAKETREKKNSPLPAVTRPTTGRYVVPVRMTTPISEEPTPPPLATSLTPKISSPIPEEVLIPKVEGPLPEPPANTPPASAE